MRLIVALCIAAVLTAGGIRCAVAAPPTSLDMHADRVDYYSNRYIVTGSGHVRVRLSDGTQLRGELFTMDLKLNRYLLAGNVRIEGSGVAEVGAGFAGYPDLDRSYFLSASGSPDKWTYLGLDFNHPQKGRQQPGDAFFIPDVSGEKPYIVASGAMIIPRTNVKFTGSRLYVLGVYVPTVSWVESFSANSNYAQNAFAGATFDIGLPYQGSLHAISAIHLRYTGTNKFFLSFDQHFVWGRDYVVFSVNPLTNEERQFNLISYKRISPKMEIRLFTQESTAQHGVYQPEVASAYENLQYVLSTRNAAFTLLADNYNTSLLQYPQASTLNDQRSYDHPSDALVALTTRDYQPVKTAPVYLRARGGLGIAHDGYHCGKPVFLSGCLGTPAQRAIGIDIGYVLDYFGNDRTRVSTIWQHFAGFSLYTSSLSLDGSKRSLNLNAVFDKQRQWFSLPHYIDTTTTTVSLSKLYNRRLAFVGAYSVGNLGDHFGARQLEFYPPYTPTGEFGVPYPGYRAFRGFATSRAWTGSAVVTPNQNFNYAVTLRRGYDFPGPIPGVFGTPPWEMTNEVRFRIARHILLDALRVDYFNWGGYQPGFALQFGP